MQSSLKDSSIEKMGCWQKEQEEHWLSEAQFFYFHNWKTLLVEMGKEEEQYFLLMELGNSHLNLKALQGIATLPFSWVPENLVSYKLSYFISILRKSHINPKTSSLLHLHFRLILGKYVRNYLSARKTSAKPH